MKIGLKELFDDLPTINLPSQLRTAVLTRVADERKRRLRQRLAVESGIVALSFSGLVLAGFYTYQGFVQSGFYQYLSLLFSDGWGYWQDLAISLAESLPLPSLALFLSLAMLFIWSAVKAADNLSISHYYNYKRI